MKTKNRFRRAMGLILFFSVAAAIMIAVTLVSVYLPPASGSTQDVTVPDLEGTQYTENDPRLPPDLYRVTVEYRTDETHGAGTVLSQSPAPNAVRRVVVGKSPCSLHLVISAGESQISLPDLTGQGADTAARMLREWGLTVKKEQRINDAYATGQVIETHPAAGTTLHRGDTVVLVESTTKTRRTLTVPDVVGMTAAEAKQALLRAGFVVDEVVYRPDVLPADTVVAQFPLGKTLVTSANTHATLTLSDGSLQMPDEIPTPQEGTPPEDGTKAPTDGATEIMPHLPDAAAQQAESKKADKKRRHFLF